MIDFGFDQVKRRHVEELNVVPILDMFIAVIFFILLTTSFVGFTKLHVPPATVGTVDTSQKAPPLSPRLALIQGEGKLILKLVWEGLDPGSDRKDLESLLLAKNPKLLKVAVEELLEKFLKKYPAERTIQMGMTPKAPYQFLIDMMDASRTRMPDVVLISYEEAQAIAGI